LARIAGSMAFAKYYYVSRLLQACLFAAWDYRNGTLTNRWTYDSGNINVGLYGQGNHNIDVAMWK
jgi:hypothetical protein